MKQILWLLAVCLCYAKFVLPKFYWDFHLFLIYKSFCYIVYINPSFVREVINISYHFTVLFYGCLGSHSPYKFLQVQGLMGWSSPEGFQGSGFT